MGTDSDFKRLDVSGLGVELNGALMLGIALRFDESTQLSPSFSSHGIATQDDDFRRRRS